MGERKPVQHYIPADFDPSKPAHRCKPQNGQLQVRWMLPMSIRCTTCGDYMFQGTKANCRKELLYNEAYLGINVYRIYMHCKSCYAEITFKTDPKNCDYIVEKGATRHFEPFRKILVENAIEEKRRLLGTKVQEAEEQAIDTQKEMDHMRELERLRAVSNKEDMANFQEILKRKQEEGVDATLSEADKEKVRQFEEMQQNELKKGIFDPPRIIQKIDFPKPSKNHWVSQKINTNNSLPLHSSPNISLIGYESDSD